MKIKMKEQLPFVFNLGFWSACLFFLLDPTMKVDLHMIRYGIARSICLQQRIFSTPETKFTGKIQGPLKEIHPAAKLHDRCSWVEWVTGKECESGAETGAGCSKFTKKSCTELGLADSNPMDTENSRIVGGTEVEKDAYPSFVRVLFFDDSEAFCSGVIINENWVLTALHCMFDPDADFFSVLAGRRNLSQREEGEQYITADRWVSYADSSNDTNNANVRKIDPEDLALIHLKKPLVLDGEKTAAVKLPTGPIEAGEVLLVGAGQETAEDDEFPTQIRQVQLDILPDEQCIEEFGDDGKFENLYLCMRKAGEMKSGCQGDSGGPVYSVGEDNSQTLVGTISFGLGGKCGSFPNVTTVALETYYYIDWIKSVTAS